MPRRARIHGSGEPLHIVLRGDNRAPCFFAEEDYFTLLHWLGESLRDSGIALHAHAPMTNRVHLRLTPQHAKDVPALMISLGRRFVQYIDKTYRRTGTQWDSRYKSSLIQSDLYLLTCQRYIELNPVRASMVDDPAHYRRSIYRAHALGAADARLTPHPAYLALGTDDVERQAAYRALFRTELDAEAIADIRLALNQNHVLGNSKFHRQIERTTGERREARPRGRPKKPGGGSGGISGEQVDLGL